MNGKNIHEKILLVLYDEYDWYDELYGFERKSLVERITKMRLNDTIRCQGKKKEKQGKNGKGRKEKKEKQRERKLLSGTDGIEKL